MGPAVAHVSLETLNQMRSDASEPRTSAGEAHWQQRAVERAIKDFDTRLKLVLDANPPQGEHQWTLVFYEVLRARNTVVHQHGYSVHQHLFGR